MRARLAAAAAVLCMAGGCAPGVVTTGSPQALVSPSSAATSAGTPGASRSAAPSPSVGAPASPPAGGPTATPAACELSPARETARPASMAAGKAVVGGVTDQGELLVLSSATGFGGDTLSLYDPGSGVVTTVARIPAARSADEVTAQIDGPTGNARWIVWEESGGTLEHDDWTMWSMDRGTGRVRKVDSFDPGPDGQAAAGWTSRVSLVGDVAAWSAPAMLGAGRSGQRIYVADLAAGTSRRLDVEGRWPWVRSAAELGAVVQVGTDAASGKVLSQPATIATATGARHAADWLAPSRLLGAAGSGSGTVVERLLREATADKPYSSSEAVVRDAAGIVRRFTMPGQFGEPAAGAGFLAWSDSLDVWLLREGASEPDTLLSVDGDPTVSESHSELLANGPWLLWRRVDFEYDWAAIRLASVACP